MHRLTRSLWCIGAAPWQAVSWGRSLPSRGGPLAERRAHGAFGWSAGWSSADVEAAGQEGIVMALGASDGLSKQYSWKS